MRAAAFQDDESYLLEEWQMESGYAKPLESEFHSYDYSQSPSGILRTKPSIYFRSFNINTF